MKNKEKLQLKDSLKIQKPRKTIKRQITVQLHEIFFVVTKCLVTRFIAVERIINLLYKLQILGIQVQFS